MKENDSDSNENESEIYNKNNNYNNNFENSSNENEEENEFIINTNKKKNINNNNNNSSNEEENEKEFEISNENKNENSNENNENSNEKKSENNSIILSNENINENNNNSNEINTQSKKKSLEFIFKVKKLGKKGYSHKSRILFINKEGISYFQMVEKNSNTKNFIEILNSLYRVIKNNDYDHVLYKKLIKEWKNLPEKEKKLKSHFQKYEVQKQEKISSFNKAPIKIVNLDARTEKEKKSPENFWIMETKEECFKKTIKDAKKLINDFIKKENEKKLKNINNNINNNNKNFKLSSNNNSNDDDNNKTKKEKKKIEISDEKDKIHFISILYQGFIKEYYNIIHKIFIENKKSLNRIEKEKKEKIEREKSSLLRKLKEQKKNSLLNNLTNKNKKKEKEKEEQIKEELLKEERAKEERIRENRIKNEKINEERTKEDNAKHQIFLELAIYYTYNIFIKFCEKIVKKIIFDLNSFESPDDIKINKKLHPFVFPNPYYFAQENNSVLLYSIWGINFTVTWNDLKYFIKNKEIKTKGKFKKIKKMFNQKDYFQNLLFKLSNLDQNVNDFPNVPLACVIDFNGFRVYCESEIFVSEEYLEAMKLNNNGNEFYFLKMLEKIICENNNNVININNNNNNNNNENNENNENIKNNENNNNNNNLNENLDLHNVAINISSKFISEEKGFNLEKFIETILNDFLKTFEKNLNFNNNNNNNNLNKNDLNTFIQSENNFVKCIKKIINNENYNINNNQIENENELKFNSYKDDSIKNHINFTFYYLMYFDVMIPKEIISNTNKQIFYREEIVFQNIDINKEAKNLFNNNNNNFIENENNINIEENNFSKFRNRSMKDYTNFSEENTKFNTNNNNNNNNNRNPHNLTISLIKKNTFQNNKQIQLNSQKTFNIRFTYLLNALDSLYLIPYNSETLKICFHYYGINLHYLGLVAEQTKIPHIRELCLIEMFARVCKKIIFSLLAQPIFDKFINVFYSNIKELITTLHRVPLTFNVLYGNEYLKSITQPVERMKYLYYNGVEVTGLYMNNEEFPLKENLYKNNNTQNSNKKDDENVNNNNNNNNINNNNNNINNNINNNNNVSNNNINSNIKSTILSNFFALLFSTSTIKNKLEIFGTEIQNSFELWQLIIKLIRINYNIKNEDVFMYCDLDSMSIYSLISAIQFHTGIKFQNGLTSILEKVGNQKIESAIFENILTSTKTSYFSFSQFLCKNFIALPLKNNFSLYFPGDLTYNQAKLNYFAEKYLYKKKISQNYYYLFYLKFLKSWDLEKKKGSSVQSLFIKEFDKNLQINDNIPVQISPIFEENFDMFIGLLRSQFQPKTINKIKNDNNNNNNNENNNNNNNINNLKSINTDSNFVFTCERVLENYWNSKHIFISILKSTFAKAMYKNSFNRKEEKKIFMFFQQSIEIAKNSVGELNVFYGKLCRDVALFFEKNFKFYEAYQYFINSYKVFRKKKNYFKKDYFYCLKYVSKTAIYLGRLKEGLEYGLKLIEEIINEDNLINNNNNSNNNNNNNKNDNKNDNNENNNNNNSMENIEEELYTESDNHNNNSNSNINEIDPLDNTIKNIYNNNNNNNNNNKRIFWDSIHNMNGFVFNIMKIAKYLKEYEKGVFIGNLFFKFFPEPLKFYLKPFKNWLDTSQDRIKELINLKNDQNNKGEYRYKTEIRLKEYGGKEKNIDNLIKIYLKCLLKGLKGEDNKIYAKAFVRIIENGNFNESVDYDEINDIFYTNFFRKNENFDDFFKNKILYCIKEKYSNSIKNNNNKEAIENNYKNAVKLLKIMYYKFPKKESKLFIN